MNKEEKERFLADRFNERIDAVLGKRAMSSIEDCKLRLTGDIIEMIEEAFNLGITAGANRWSE